MIFFGTSYISRVWHEPRRIGYTGTEYNEFFPSEVGNNQHAFFARTKRWCFIFYQTVCLSVWVFSLFSSLPRCVRKQSNDVGKFQFGNTFSSTCFSLYTAPSPNPAPSSMLLYIHAFSPLARYAYKVQAKLVIFRILFR